MTNAQALRTIDRLIATSEDALDAAINRGDDAVAADIECGLIGPYAERACLQEAIEREAREAAAAAA